MITEYNKIVRDKIPQIIESSGKKCRYSTEESSEVSHFPALCRKLDEEVEEFHKAIYVNEEIEELADILEVVYTIANYLHYSEEDMGRVRKSKIVKKGGFNKLVFLYEVEE